MSVSCLIFFFALLALPLSRRPFFADLVPWTETTESNRPTNQHREVLFQGHRQEEVPAADSKAGERFPTAQEGHRQWEVRRERPGVDLVLYLYCTIHSSVVELLLKKFNVSVWRLRGQLLDKNAE